MPAGPPPPFGTVSRDAVEWGVFLGPGTFAGDWDSDANSPALASGTGTTNACYRVSVDGTTALDGIATWVVGDEAFFNGSVWKKNDPRRPKLTDRVDWLYPESIHLATNGQSHDTIQLRVITEKAGIRVQDINVPLGYSKLIEVRQRDDVGGWSIIKAWGAIASQGQALGTRHETLKATARLDWFLFGGRLKWFYVWDTVLNALPIERDIVFNPMVDGQIEGNRSNITDSTVGTSAGGHPFFFIDPESMRTETARTLQAQDRQMWDLPQAIHAICWLLNPNETFIKNPKLSDLQAVITDTSTRLLRNRVIPLGHNLPLALDLLCEPMAYRWYVKNSVDTTDPALPAKATLQFFKNGTGILTDLKCNRVGEDKTSDETNIDDYSATLDISKPNVVYGRGGLQQREGTFELIPGWPRLGEEDLVGPLAGKVILDNMSLLEIDGLIRVSGKDRDLRYVGRTWVLNEAGDFGNRPGVAAFFDLAPVFGVGFTNFPRMVRRRFLPCLSKTFLGDANQHGPVGYFLEYNRSKTNVPDWVEYRGMWSVRTSQCAVDLESNVPEEFWSLVQMRFAKLVRGDFLDPSLRITAVIEGDNRLSYTAERRTEAPNGRNIPLHLDVDDRFHDRRLVTTGTNKSKFLDSPKPRHYPIAAFFPTTPPTYEITGEDLVKRLPKGTSICIIDDANHSGRYIVEAATLVGADTQIDVQPKIPVVTDALAVGAILCLDTEEADDLPDLRRLCDEARNAHDGAEVAVSASLKGHDHPEYERGCLVKQVQTRNLKLDNYNAAAPSSRYPQIIGINYHFASNSQRTELVLEVPDAERPELAKAKPTTAGDWL